MEEGQLLWLPPLGPLPHVLIVNSSYLKLDKAFNLGPGFRTLAVLVLRPSGSDCVRPLALLGVQVANGRSWEFSVSPMV